MSSELKVRPDRSIRALCLVIAGFMLLAVFALRNGSASDGSLDGEKVSATLVLSAGEGRSDEVVLDELSTYESELPVEFKRELFSIEGSGPVYSDERGTVFAFVAEGRAGERFELLCEQMEAGGWRRVESGVENCASFVKEGGAYRWAMVSCYDISGKTTVVAQVQPPAV